MGAESRAREADQVRTAIALGDAQAAAQEHLKNQPRPDQHQLVDQFGFPIIAGASYTLHNAASMIVQVVDIKPDLRRNVPPDSWQVVLVAQIPARAMARVPMQGLQFIAGPINQGLVSMPGTTTEPAGTAPDAPAPTPPGAPTTPSGLILSNPDA